ncbi:MAG: tetratricopeptide repeat protein [Planctomycetes bacterium]|nr:tetratricopeptide repeat protein [Planctomycetota bacterium]
MQAASRCACGYAWQGAPPKACPRCGKGLGGALGTSSELSLDLKDVMACPHCRFECYEDDLQDGACPRCQRPVRDEEEDEGEDEGDEGDADEGEEERGPRVPRARRRPGGRPGAKKKVGRKGPRAAPPPQPEKKKVILDEQFKQRVFGAFRRADAGAAQQECLALVDGNEEHAKQIYSHLLEIAKKKNWIGVDRQPAAAQAPAPSPAAPAPPVDDPLALPPGFLEAPAPLDPGGALPLPAGLLGDPVAGGGALPLPPGLLGPEPLPPPPTPAVPAPAPVAPVTPLRPQPGGTPPGGVPRPVAAGPAMAPTTAPRTTTPPPAPRPQGPPPEPEPEERGFLARVAVEGRAAQVSLLCLAGHYGAARDLAQTTLARDPYTARAHAALGEALAGLGQDAQALSAYTNAVRADPNDAAVVRGYAQVLARLGRHAEAVAAYRRLVGPGKGEPRDIVALAAALRRAGDAAGAQRVFEELVRRDPQSLEPVRQQGEALLAGGDVDGAAACLERIQQQEAAPYAIALTLAESIAGAATRGGSPRAALACGRTFLTAGRPLAAVRALAPLVARDPNDVDLERTLGLAYARLGAGALAEKHLLAVAQRGAAGADEFLALGEVYLERGDTVQGARALSQAVRARPEDPSVRRALARALAAQGDLEGALRELKAAHHHAGADHAALEDELDRITERAFAKRVRQIEERLQAQEDDAQARLDLAEALFQRGDLADAVSHIERASQVAGFLDAAVQLTERLLEDADTKRPLVLLLATLFERHDDPARAIVTLEEYLAAAPDDPELRLVLYRCYAATGRMQEAVVGLRALLQDAPPSQLQEAVALAARLLEQEGYQALAPSVARAERRLGHVDAAARLFRRHLEAEPEDADARHELATLLEDAGQVGEAYEVLKVILDDGQGTTAELERLATLALGAGKVDHAVELLGRCVDRHPEDLSLRHALEAAEARQRDEQIRALRGATREEDRLRLAALCAEAGRAEQAIEILRALGRLGDNPELSYLRFSAEHFARTGKTAKAEAAMRQVGAALSYAPGSDAHKQLLCRVAAMYEHAGERRAARRVYLEVHALDPRFQDVEARLEAMSDDVAGQAAGALDARLVELVDVGAPLGTIFDALGAHDLALDPRHLESFRT